ncbi:MAG: bifunctional metallophosphatase/5'-nucleotidase [Bacteriovorax sp.]|nr:bifunctional metallophosphatase/5'-nucleotidase [Bacteriovorax sp.]
MKNSKLLKTFILIAAIAGPAISSAKLIQILHTNDTHSFLDNSDHSTTRGGAARLKAMIDQYKAQASAEGVSTLVVDAGDFLEGNVYFMADGGRKTFDVHNEIGYDIGTLGNHDYQMGSAELDKLLGNMDLKFSLIVANIDAGSQYKNINEKIKPYKEVVIDGIKIGILGLTTDEILYKWRLQRGAISNPIEAAQRYENSLSARNDFVIALTHIGVLKDIKLAEKTKYIDLIIGGHSHTALYEPTYAINKQKNIVPIVQAGMHTEYLGRLVLDLEKGKPLKIASYELIPVRVDEDKVDPAMTELVKQADQELNTYYGNDWLNEKLGFSDLKANDALGSRKWAYFIADTMKEKAGADIAIHMSEMNGSNYPVGIVTRRTILNSIPRIFEIEQKYGWDIYTTHIKGAWLRITMDALSYVGQPLTFSGIKMEYERGPLGFKIRNITVNGKKVNPFKTYTVAFTEGIIRGAQGIDPRTIAILRNPKNTEFKIWAALEEKIRKTETINKICEEGEDHTILFPNK